VGVLILKSVEFLIALALILSVYAPLYRVARGYKETSNQFLEDFNHSIVYRQANTLVRNLMVYGEPFEYSDFGNLNPSELEDVDYNPILNQYTYQTYSRW